MKNELNIRCIMSKDTLPVTGNEQAVYALVDITAGAAVPVGTLPSNIALVLDRSGSMDGEKMDRLTEAAGYVMDRMADEDLVSVTIFDDQVETLVPSQPAKNRDEMRSKLAGLIARGGTQISDGLSAGLREAKKGSGPGRTSRVLLLTDGRTWDDEDACLKLADDAGTQGVAITSIGIGDDWNENLLLQIAERSHGNSHWIQDPVAILDAFRQEVEGMRSTAATSLKITGRMAGGATPVRVYTTAPMIADISGRSIHDGMVQAELGSLDAATGQKVLIEARVPAQKAGPFRLGQVEIGYDVPSQVPAGRTVTADLDIAFAANAADAAKVNADVMNLVEKVTAFKLQTRALTEARTGNIAAATRQFKAAATVLLDLGEDGLADAVEREILSLRKTGAFTAAGTKKLEYGTRKLTQALK